VIATPVTTDSVYSPILPAVALLAFVTPVIFGVGIVAFATTVPAVSPVAVPVRLVATPEDGVPRAGVIRVGLVCRTEAPVPV
jgi:hypothetical protein